MNRLMRRPGIADLTIALAGTFVFGAILGLPEGPEPILSRALSTPLILVGLLVSMLPPLYIASALLGVAPAAPDFFSSAGTALRKVGLVLLGFAPPLAFLISTTSRLESVWILGCGVLGLAVLVASRALYRGLFAHAVAGRKGQTLQVPLFLLWLGVGLAIGSQLFQHMLL